VNEDQTVEQRYIVTGETFGVGMIIRDGLTEGEQVIVEGLQRVRPGAIVDPVLANQAGEE
jgi:membrane fusion protein (multidrug efflux system)